MGYYCVKNGLFESAKLLYRPYEFKLLAWKSLLWNKYINNGEYYINIYADNQRTFKLSCYSGNLEMSKWLYKLSEMYKHPFTISSKLFAECCRKGDIEIVKWLY